jgi:protein DGCR14
MSSSNSRALVKVSTETQLMPPPSKRIKRPQKVLDEDTYTDAISQIIARDFFPGLLETETQQEYLDALESEDRAWISSAGKRLAQIMGASPRQRGRRGTSIRASVIDPQTPRDFTGDTPTSVVSNYSTMPAQDTAKPEVDTNMSLDAFQSKYTSEDNESFYKLLDKQNQKRAEKYAWMWRGNKLPSNQQLKQKEVEAKLLGSRGTLEDNGWKKDRLAIKDANEKPAMPDGWKSQPNNNFMFGPDSVEDSLLTVAQKAQAESKAPPKGVVYNNTRIPVRNMPDQSTIPPSPSLSAVREAISGRPRIRDTESIREQGETPRVNGYAFVDDEPEEHEYDPPTPTIDLGKGDATPNPFKIKEQSAREDLHHRIVDETSKRKRSSSHLGLTGKVDKTPVPKFPSSPRVGAGGLTPAAQRLWSRVGSSSKSNTPGVFGSSTPNPRAKGSGLRSKWTPTRSADGKP